MTHDEECLQGVTQFPAVAVSWLLMASYAYYHRDTNILSDECFDGVAKLVKATRHRIKHRHLGVLPESFWTSTTSSLFDLKATDYPMIVRSAACRLAGISFRMDG